MSNRSTHRILRLVLAAAALIFAGTATGCASFWTPITSTTTTNATGSYIYVGKNSSSTLAGYVVGTGGTLTAISATLTLPAAPNAMAVSPNNDFLYVGTASGVYGYQIVSGGALTALNSGSALLSLPVAALDVSPDGNWLVAIATSPALNTNSTAGYLCQISSITGLTTTTPVALPAPATGTGEAVRFAPTEAGSGVSAIAASFGTAGVYIYNFQTSTTSGGYQSTTGPLLPSTVANASYDGLTWNSGATQIYFVSGGGDDTLYAYNVNAGTGANSLAGFITTGTSDPTQLAFDSSGAYLYVTNSGTLVAAGSTINGYTLTINGGSTTFNVLSSSPFSASCCSPSAIAADGGYMIVVNQTYPPDVLLDTVDYTNILGRLYVTSSLSTGYGVVSGTSSGTGVSIAVAN